MSLLLLVFLVLVIGAVIAVVVFVAINASSGRAVAGVTSVPAQVIEVKQVVLEGRPQALVALRFVDGRRRELLTTRAQAETMFMGQRGQAHWSGDRLTGWVPELGGPQDSHRSE